MKCQSCGQQIKKYERHICRKKSDRFKAQIMFIKLTNKKENV